MGFLLTNKQILFLSLVCLSIYHSHGLQKHNLAGAQALGDDGNNLNNNNNNRLANGDRNENARANYSKIEESDSPTETEFVDFAAEDEEGEATENEVQDVPEQNTSIASETPQSNDSETKKVGQVFSWKHHHDDHGLYAGRSLMTSASSKPFDHDIAAATTTTTTADEDGEEETESNEEVVRRQQHQKSRVRAKAAQDDDFDPLKTIDYAEKEWQLMFRAFDSAHESLSSSILQELGKQTNLLDEIVSKLKPQCRRDINYIRESVRKHKLWALRMIDSMGKLPSGITYGRFSSPGDYEECLSVQVDDKLFRDVKNNLFEKHKFHGKYCLLDFRLPLPERPRNKLLSVHESVLNFTGTEIGEKYPEMIGNFSAYASVFYEVGYLHGFCLPSSCDVKDLTKSMTRALEGMYLIVNTTVDCEERPSDGSTTKPIRTSQWISIALMVFVFVNALLASLAYQLLPKEIRKQPNQQRAGNAGGGGGASNQQNQRKSISMVGQQQHHHHHQLQDTLKKLSKLEEAKRISISGGGKQETHDSSLYHGLAEWSLRNRFYADCFSIQKNFERLTKPDPRGLTFVHYTRIVAMALTVITHTGALGTLQAITKPADASNSEQIFRDLIPQMLANAFTSIQIFFFMAGFMLVISTFPSIKRDRGHISFLEYAVKRAIRLMPGIAATICLNFIWPLLVDGPMLSYFDRMIVQPCETTWWHTMAFMSNFDHVEKMCLRHSYFSASDYQLHIMAFPLLILLYKQPTLALFLAAILTVAGFVAQIIMILTKTVLPFMMVDYIDKEAFFNVVHYIHHPVWNHMSAFFYGFIVGYLVVKQIRFQLKPTTIKRIWFIMMPAGVISIFAPYFWNHYKRPIEKWQMVLYAIFDRSILLTTCSWLSYATMVLARKPPQQKKSGPTPGTAGSHQPGAKLDTIAPNKGGVGVKSPIMRVLSKGHVTQLAATFDNSTNRPTVAISQDMTDQQTTAGGMRPRAPGGSSGSLTSLPRQRSSPNLAYLQQQQQQQLQGLDLSNLLNPSSGGRLSRTTSSSNLATIAETSAQQVATQTLGSKSMSSQQVGGGATELPTATKEEVPSSQQSARPRPQAPVSNLNTLCLVLSRLTFQLYLFNMVVLWIDVNHSKYFWFFSYYFIVFKASAVYICSALLAMVFFVVLESPSLTLYIAWVKGRAAARAKQRPTAAAAAAAASGGGHLPKLSDLKIVVPPPLATTIIVDKNIIVNHNQQGGGEPMELTSADTKQQSPTFSYIDHHSTSSSPGVEMAVSQKKKNKSQGGATNEAYRAASEKNQTKM